MHPQLQAIIDDLHAARARFERLAAATPDAKWAKRADPAAWSVAECIQHLNLTARAMQILLERAGAMAKDIGHAPPARYKRSIFGAFLGATVGPLIGWGKTRFGRIKTPPPFMPAGELERSRVTKEFLDHFAAHEGALRAIDGAPIDKVRVASPFVQGAGYDAYSGWIILARHIHRHLAQAERVWS